MAVIPLLGFSKHIHAMKIVKLKKNRHLKILLDKFRVV
jgi:hypothetical protein